MGVQKHYKKLFAQSSCRKGFTNKPTQKSKHIDFVSRFQEQKAFLGGNSIKKIKKNI
jgi:hypothetical protein